MSDPPPNHALVREHVLGIARTHQAVTYHPEDPARAVIEATAREIGLATVPSPTVRFRRIVGCPLPPPAVSTVPLRWGTPGEFAEAVTALAAAFTNPGMYQRCTGCGGSGLTRITP